MPWVVETRIAPGAKPRRNPMWGVVALVLALLGAGMFFLGMSLPFLGLGDLIGYLLAVWGVNVLATIVFTAVAFAKRGSANWLMASIAALVLVMTNPVLYLVIVTYLGL